MSRVIWMLGVAAFFVGMALMLPALAALRDKWSPAAMHGAMLMLGGLVALAGACAAIYGIATARHPRRTA